MLIAIIGENCVGKSTLAEGICREIGGKIFNGKDFLRLERNPDNAKATFKAILSSAVDGDNADQTRFVPAIQISVCKRPLCQDCGLY